jgi:hypothetical protein
MTHSQAIAPSRTARWGWGIVLTVSALLIVNGAFLYFIEFETQIERTLALLLVGLGAHSLTVGTAGWREGARWAWHAGWVLAGVMAAVAVHILVGDGEVGVGLFYVFLAATIAVGQLLSRQSLSS